MIPDMSTSSVTEMDISLTQSLLHQKSELWHTKYIQDHAHGVYALCYSLAMEGG